MSRLAVYDQADIALKEGYCVAKAGRDRRGGHGVAQGVIEHGPGAARAPTVWRRMHVRAKKLIGTGLTLVFLIIYCFIAMLLAAILLPDTSGIAQLAYFAVAGLLWIVPVGALIAWMQRPS